MRPLKPFVGALAILLVGCDADPTASGWFGDAVETARRHHRTQSGGQVGSLRAMETHHRAATLTSRIAHRPDPWCGRTPSAARSGTTTLTVSGEISDVVGEQLRARFTDERTIVVDDDGSIEVVWHTTFSSPTGRSANAIRHERVVGQYHYVKEHNLGWVRHRVRPNTSSRVLQRGRDAYELVAGLGKEGWKELEPGKLVAEEQSGGRAISCARSHDGWLRRLLRRTRLSYAELEHTEEATTGPWRRRASLRLLVGDEDTPRIVRFDVDEIETAQTRRVVAPSPADVVDTRRDRTYRENQSILNELGLDGT